MRSDRANPDARNYGLGSRDMGYAGLNALKEQYASFGTISTMHQRWCNFCEYMKQQGVKDMRKVTLEHVKGYAEHLKSAVASGKMSAATAQNYLSAVNRVLAIARGDNKVRVDPVKQGDLARRSGICTQSKSVSQADHDTAMRNASPRTAALLNLQRSLGLRFEESAKLNANKALAQAQKTGTVRIIDGTKGGRARFVPVTQSGIDALRKAASVQGNDRSMIPKDQNYKDFRSATYSETKALGVRCHGERHAYAQQRYEKLTGCQCAVASGAKHGQEHHAQIAKAQGISIADARQLDHAARLDIAEELGHGRIDVTNAYLG